MVVPHFYKFGSWMRDGFLTTLSGSHFIDADHQMELLCGTDFFALSCVRATQMPTSS